MFDMLNEEREFTGIKDFNGKKIYLGDRIQIGYNGYRRAIVTIDDKGIYRTIIDNNKYSLTGWTCALFNKSAI